MAEFVLNLARRDGVIHCCAQGSLRAEGVEAIRAELTPLCFSRPWLVVADLRELETVDDVGAAALREVLRRLPRVALLMPKSWSQAFFSLRPMFVGLPFYQMEDGDRLAAALVPIEERRHAPRLAVKMLASIVNGTGRACDGWTLDLSRSGARVATSGSMILDERPIALCIAATTIRVRPVRFEPEPQNAWVVQFTGPLGALAPLLASLE
jgi:hypothetical protein